MIDIKQIKNTKRQWKFKSKVEDDIIELELNLLQFSLTNKFEIVADIFKEMNKKVPEFSLWFHNLLKDYIDNDYDENIILKSAPDFVKYSKEYIKIKNVDFSKFVDNKKSTKSSILFEEKDIEVIAITSTALKLSSIFFYESNLKVNDNIQRSLYSVFIKECIDNKTTDKIFQLVKARTYKSSITDRFMWNLIKMSVLETPETNVMSVFNFMMTNLISLLDININPVHYLIRVADDSVRWMFCEVYKEKIVYGETFSGADDIYSSSVNSESFYIYCCNDVIAKASKAGLNILEQEYGIDEDDLLDIKERLDSVNHINPTMKWVILPIASKVLEIPYKYLLTASPKHIILIGVLLYYLGEDIFCKKYPILSNFLKCYPEKPGIIFSKSSYKLRDVDELLSNDIPMFGLNSRKLKFEVISPICGILSASKRYVANVIDGEKINKITYNDLEADATQFYVKLYSNQLQPDFEELKLKLDEIL